MLGPSLRMQKKLEYPPPWGCALAIATRCSAVCGKCGKLLPILTSKHVSPLTRGKVLSACILLHGSETWAPTAPDCRNDSAMIRCICGVKPLDEKIVSEYDQEIPQSQTADNPVAPRGRAAQPSQDTRKTN